MDKAILYEKLKAAVIDGLEYVKANEEEFFRYGYSNYHNEDINMSYDATGYPSFSKSLFSKKNYYGLFIKDNTCNNFESWKAFQQYLLSNDQYCKYFFLGKYSERTKEDQRIFMDNFYTQYPIASITERYIHLNRTKELNEEKLKELFNEWSNSFLLDKLNFDIVVPILMTSFDFDEFEINPNLMVVRMSDLFQRSRNTKTSTNSSPHVNVISSATHAFVLKNYSIPNENDKSLGGLGDIGTYTNVIADIIDKLFAYLRSASMIETGYSQIIANPHDWAISWTADFIPIRVASTKVYPDYFENYYWNYTPEKLPSNIFKTDIIEKYLATSQRNLQVAIERLNNAFLRRHIDDSILDITIALEALFIESVDNAEITHKLATRVAGLCKKFPLDSFTPFQIFKMCKNIYEFRSAIVHSKDKKKVDRSRNLKSEIHPSISSVEAGLKLLAHSVNVLIQNPTFLNVEELDKSLFEGIVV